MNLQSALGIEDNASPPRRVAFVDVTQELLVHCLHLPSSTRIVNAWLSTEVPDAITIQVEHESLGKVAPGCRIPKASPHFCTTRVAGGNGFMEVIQFAGWGQQ